MNYLKQNYKLIITAYLFGLIFIILHSGIWIMPNIGAEFLISQLWKNPKYLMIHFPPTSQYLLAQFLEPFLFSLLNLHKPLFFIGFLFIENLASCFIFTFWFLQFHNFDEGSIYKYFLVLCFPVFTLPFYWMGMNSMVILLLILSMIFYDSLFYYIFAFLLGFQSSAIGINAFIILGISLIFYKIFNDKFESKLSYFKDKDILKSFVGALMVLFGKGILLSIFHHIGINRTANAFTWIEIYWKELIKQWLLGWNVILYSIYGIMWIAILNRAKFLWYLFPPTILSFLLTIIANDETRIALLVLFPSLFYFIIKNKSFFDSFSNKEILVYMFVFFISPFLYVWGGIPYAISLIPSDLYIFHHIRYLKGFNWNKPWILSPH